MKDTTSDSSPQSGGRSQDPVAHEPLSVVGRIGAPDDILDVAFDHVYTYLVQMLTRYLPPDLAHEYAQAASFEMFEKYLETGVLLPLEEMQLEALKIARKAARRGRTAAARTVSIDDDDLHELIENGALSPIDALIENEKRDLMLATVDSMPTRQRLDFRLHMEDDMSFEEMARQSGNGVSAGRKNVARVCAQLLKKLNVYEELPHRKRKVARGKRRDAGEQR